jgi:hypothetical protein
MSWERTMELRFTQTYYSKADNTTGSYKILQQKWVERQPMIVSDAPGVTRTDYLLTGEVDWRDVPLIEEKSDDLAD